MSKATKVLKTDGGHVTVSAAAAHAAKLKVAAPKFPTLAKAKAGITKAVSSFVRGTSNLERDVALSLTPFLILSNFDKAEYRAMFETVRKLAEGYSLATLQRIFSNVKTIVRSDVQAMADVSMAWNRGEYTTTVGAAYRALTAHREATGASKGDGRGKARRKNNKAAPKADAKLSPSQIAAAFMRWDAATRVSILEMLQSHHREAVEKDAASMAEAVDAKLAAPRKRSRKVVAK